MFTAVEEFKGWKDPRAYHAVLGVCVPCHDGKRTTKLPTRAKALNHWSANGSGKDKAATIRDCPLASKVPGLVAYARAENKKRFLAKK